MTRSLPVVPTAIVLLAVGIMVALGLWQLQRMDEKEALVTRYGRALTLSSSVPWPRAEADYGGRLYRHATVDCAEVRSIEAMAGRSRDGRTGWAQIADCRLADGSNAVVAIGWSSEPRPPQWSGGKVEGVIGPAGKGIRLVAGKPEAGLEPLAPPDPANLPNNHLSYAVQWFLFAATALIIYALALRKRWRAS